jgi:hypothetical protein
MQSEPRTGMIPDPPAVPPPAETYISEKYGSPRCTAVHPTFGQCEVKQGRHSGTKDGDIIHDTTEHTWVGDGHVGGPETGRYRLVEQIAGPKAQDTTRAESVPANIQEMLDRAQVLKVSPGDSVLLVLRDSPSDHEIAQVQDYLHNWEPRVAWQIASGVTTAVHLVAEVKTDSGLILPDQGPK